MLLLANGQGGLVSDKPKSDEVQGSDRLMGDGAAAECPRSPWALIAVLSVALWASIWFGLTCLISLYFP
jgi:hypothetical protein